MFIADFHIHSKYSRATSRECVPETLEMWARRKGLDLIGTGDFTHPAWRAELNEKLAPSGEGLYTLKKEYRQPDEVAGADCTPQFIVSGEISSIYKKNGRVRKVHNLILLPGLEPAETIARRLEAIGNVHSDGRPILGLDSRDLLEIVLDACPEAIFIPAHIWTPHFSVYGAYSGFDDIQECFEDLTGYIYALETGLSSDPPMNWRLSALDNFALVSNSDAHSPANLAREANLFDTEIAYPHLLQALKNRSNGEFYGTIEFFPEEGKYHYDGHRNCKVCWKPEQTKVAAGVCPACGGRITVGVLHRVEALADRQEGFVLPTGKHFESLIPLPEVIASSMGVTGIGVKVKRMYEGLIRDLGPELFILREASLHDIERAAGPCVAESINRLRQGRVEIHPGYDGEYGRIKIMDQSEIALFSGQLCFFEQDETSEDGQKQSALEALKDKKGTSQEIALLPDLTDAGPLKGGEEFSSGTLYGLNREQWEAASARDGAIAVMAGPGTGKTKTLVGRIAYLVEQCGVHPSQITAVTFTNKAAREMRLRLEKQFGNKRTAKAMTIGTFHSIGLQILSKGKNKNSLTIIDEYTALSILEEIIKDSRLKLSPRDALRGISLIKSGASLPEDNVPSEIYDLYCSRLAQYGVMDYDDILLEALAYAEDSRDRATANPFSYLLVDEFQDINEIQYRLIKAWGQDSESVFIIGDPDQSIYGFRGSDFRYFEKFKEDFPDLRQVQLTQNYRSTPEIVLCAQSVISKGSESYARSLEAKRGQGAQVRLLEANDEFSEAVFVAKEINRLVGGMDMLDSQALSAAGKKGTGTGHPRGFSDMAVLYRTNRQAEVLERCLVQEGIPYVVAGRDEFLSDPQVRRAIAFFRFLLDPGDLVSLRVCLRSGEAYPADLVKKILDRYTAAEKSLAALALVMTEMPLPPVLDGSAGLTDLLQKYEPVIHKEKPASIIEGWAKDNQLAGLKGMELLYHTAVFHDRMADFIQNLVLGRESDVVRSGGKTYSSDAVSLMTMHGAKGLEFPVVFLCGVNEGVIPFRGGSHDDDNRDEERRLFYVGMTRAQDELILLTSRTPSPFIADIPEEHLVKGQAFPRKPASRSEQLSLF